MLFSATKSYYTIIMAKYQHACSLSPLNQLNCKIMALRKDDRTFVTAATEQEAFELMFCLCARIGELRALRWSDVDFDKHTISISREIVLRKNEEGKNRFVEVNHTKGGEHGSRVLPLSERAERVLYELRSQKLVSEL